MYQPDFNTIKSEQQERIDNAPGQPGMSHARRVARLARRDERHKKQGVREADAQVRRRAVLRQLHRLVRRSHPAS